MSFITTNSSQIQSQIPLLDPEVPSKLAPWPKDHCLSQKACTGPVSHLEECKRPLLEEVNSQPQLAESKICFSGNFDVSKRFLQTPGSKKSNNVSKCNTVFVYCRQ